MVSKRKTSGENPWENANVFSKLCFWWLKSIFYKGSFRDLQTQDLYEPVECDRSEVLGDRLEREWYAEVAKRGEHGNSRHKASLLRCIVRVFFWSFSLQGILMFLQYVVFRNLQTIFFGWLIIHFDRNTPVTKEQAYFYAAGVVLTAIASALAGSHANFGVQRIGMEIRIACSSLAYRKILRLSRTSLEQTAGGQILNLLSNDMQRFDVCPAYLHYIWIMPIQIILISYLIWRDVGIATFAGVAAILVQTIPFQGYIGRLCANLREQIAELTDQRVQFMNELISGIQVIKMYAWENAFERIANVLRAREMKLITLASYCRGLYLSIMVFGERVALFVTLTTLVLIGNDVNAKVVFTMAAYWQMLQSIMAVFFPLAITFAGEALISVKRLEELMELEEHVTRPIDRQGNVSSSNDETNIAIHKLSANWVYGTLPPTLYNVNLQVKKGQLCALVGPVGSGKSSILQLILGELPAATGVLDIRGKTISYAAQEAWLFGGTVRENILFGLPYDRKKYEEVTEACALQKDFQQLSRGDLTFVGERGASLSGGQRARINLARAVYRDADIYLLDDPLSAVDTRVGRQLFVKCINTYLRGKTRILVTHQLQYLKNADTIVVLKDGCVDSQGTFEDLTSSSTDFANLTNTFCPVEEEPKDTASCLFPGTKSQRSTIRITEPINSEPELLEEEEVAKGRMSFDVYKQYFAATGSILLRVSALLIIIATQVATSGVDYWVTSWANQESLKQSMNFTDSSINSSSRFEVLSDTSDVSNITRMELDRLHTTNTNITIYGGLILACVVLPLIRNTMFLRMCVSSSKVLYGRMFTNLLQATMRFFNTNPSGRILNRFSKDIGAMDETLPRCMAETISIISMTLGSLIMIVFSNNWMIIPVLILGGVSNLARQYYLATAQDIKRLEGVGKSPVFSHVNYSLDGITTIRSSGAQHRMIREFDSRQNLHTSAWFLFVATGTAFGLLVDTIIAAFIALICFTFVIFDDGNTMSGNVGLAISQSLWLSDAIQFGIKESVRLVAEMTSAERVLQYTNLPLEGPFASVNEPPLLWPQFGELEFQNLSLKYDDEKPAVLKDINVHISPGQKVGIVGRTGAGKSSIVAALLRLANLEGRVMIDGIDTQSIGLHDLRSKISVIPQAPILFSGTLRHNLDPFNEFSDDHMWAALDELGLKQAFATLDTEINQGGGNMSLGNRQLVCLARAILRNNKILVLDEATANIDPGTDALIQETIRKKFGGCTVLTIAHRLGTIIDNDRVLILDAGRIVEFGHPRNLLENPTGHFTKMVKGTGVIATRKIA